MKTNSKITLFLIMVCSFILTACTPGNYTKEHRDEITKLHEGEAKDWFDTNLPDAKVKSAKAYATGTDLYAAISGEYELNNNRYSYLYDYYNDSMYLGQEYDNCLSELDLLISDYLGIDSENVEVHLYSSTLKGINTKLENDSYKKSDEVMDNGFGTIIAENVIPYDVTGKEYADLIFSGEDALYEYSIDAYVDEIPNYIHQVFEDNKNLMYINYERPIGWNYKGIYQATYYANFVTEQTICIKPLGGDVFGGYYVSEKREYDETLGDVLESTLEDTEVKSSIDGNGNISIEVPARTTPILFAKSGKYYNRFINNSGEEVCNELNKMEKNVSGAFFDGYDVYEAQIHLPRSKYQGYSLKYMKLSENGKYTLSSK